MVKLDVNTQLLDASPQPVLLVDGEARLVYANPAAQQVVPAFIAHRVHWAREIGKLAGSRALLPTRVAPEVLPEDLKNWQVWVAAEGDAGYALYFMNLPAETDKAGGSPAGRRLIGRALRDEMKAYAGQLREAFSSIAHATGMPGQADLMRQTRRLADQTDELVMLAEMEEVGASRKDDRIYLYSLTNQLCADLQAARHADVAWDVDPAGALLAPVYGNRRWLSMALQAYFLVLATSSPRVVRVKLQFRQEGGNAVISGRTFIDDRDSYSPPVAAGHAPDRDPVLSVAVARRILELHGAEIRLVRAEQRIDGFSITLPTSFPFAARPDIWCQDCASLKQSVAIARDFAAMMETRRD